VTSGRDLSVFEGASPNVGWYGEQIGYGDNTIILYIWRDKRLVGVSRRAGFRGGSQDVGLGLRLHPRILVSGDGAHAQTANSQCADECKDQNNVSPPNPTMRKHLTLRSRVNSVIQRGKTSRQMDLGGFCCNVWGWIAGHLREGPVYLSSGDLK
jgi:hypothetical protein